MNKKLRLFLAGLPVFFTACQYMPSNTATSNSSVTNAQLTSYAWQYQPQNQTDSIRLNFEPKGALYIQTPCNHQSGVWKQQDAKHIVTSDLASTMKMCSPEKMQLEKWSAQLLSKQQLQYQISGNSTAPVLILTNQQGQQYQFTGTLKPEVKYQGQAQTVFFEVAPQTENCNGQQQCLRVKEVRYDANGLKQPSQAQWHTLTTPIEGYQHDPNISKIIRVKKYMTDQGDVFLYDMTVEQRLITH